MKLHKLVKEGFPKKRTKANTFEFFGESFYIAKKFPDGKTGSMFTAYNWKTRNKITSAHTKDALKALLDFKYKEDMRKADYEAIEMVFVPHRRVTKKSLKEDNAVDYRIEQGNRPEWCEELSNVEMLRTRTARKDSSEIIDVEIVQR